MSSSPRKKMATFGLALTEIRSCPVAASNPTIGGVNLVPDAKRRSPSLHSTPAGRIFAPASIVPAINESVWVTFSHGMTASAPRGTTPPVEIRIHSPATIISVGALPICTSPITRHGPLRATAQPSIEEVSKAGRSQSEYISSASVRPTASAIATD